MNMQRIAKNLFKLSLRAPSVSVSHRTAAYWNKDWKPGPYPKTSDEHAEAAKKYHLLPEDYKPYADDGLAAGDYPMIRPYYEGNRDPWEVYDYYPERRNFNEPLTWNHEVYREGWLDPDEEQVTYAGRSLRFMITMAIVPFLMYAGLMYLGEQYKYFSPMKPKHFPESGETHYSFEPAE